MLRRFCLISFTLLVISVVAATLDASKALYQAKLSTSAELHDVIGSDARGSAFVATAIGGSALNFRVLVRGLSEQPNGAHLHGPATEAENAGVLISLCGSPAPAALPVCNFDGDTMDISGVLTSGLAAQWGLTSSEFRAWLDDGLVYINVHTELNPAGEVRGQLQLR